MRASLSNQFYSVSISTIIRNKSINDSKYSMLSSIGVHTTKTGVSVFVALPRIPFQLQFFNHKHGCLRVLNAFSKSQFYPYLAQGCTEWRNKHEFLLRSVTPRLISASFSLETGPIIISLERVSKILSAIQCRGGQKQNKDFRLPRLTACPIFSFSVLSETGPLWVVCEGSFRYFWGWQNCDTVYGVK